MDSTMNNKWLGIIFLTPIIAVCKQDVAITSDVISTQQIETIITNVNNQYPDAEPSLKQDIADVVVKSIENMVFVEGGSFMMGDFLMPCMNDDLNRPVWTPEAKCYSDYTSVETGANFLHKVTLDSYSISKYEAEMLDLDVYFQTLGLPFLQWQDDGEYLERTPSELAYFIAQPVRTKTWQQANDYCQWLGSVASLPFYLPTEAQWEYSARSRGENLYYATNNGFLQYENDIYYDEEDKVRKNFKKEDANVGSSMRIVNVGYFPPNPLGIYGMTKSTVEWVSDWYADDYYKYSPELNPTGPKVGTEKVVRGIKNIYRGYKAPVQKDYSYHLGFRCAIQQSKPVYAFGINYP